MLNGCIFYFLDGFFYHVIVSWQLPKHKLGGTGEDFHRHPLLTWTLKKKKKNQRKKMDTSAQNVDTLQASVAISWQQQ